MSVVVAMIVIWCAVFALWSWLKPRRPSPPVYPGALPIIGHAHLLIGDAKYFWKAEREVYQFCLENGGVVEIRLGPHPLYVITNLEDCLVVLNTCLDKPYIYGFAKEMYDRGLVTADVLTWKTHRKLLNPSFNQQVLNTFVQEYSEQARNLVSQLAFQVGKGPFDVQPYLIKHFIKTVCKTSLGIETHDQSKFVMEYTHATEDLFTLYLERIQKVWLHLSPIFNMSSLKKRHDVLIKTLKDTTNAIINERKSELEPNKHFDIKNESTEDKYKPLLDQMLNLTNKQNCFTDEEIREHLDTIIAATYDTTTKAMTFTLILIGSHEDVQAKIVKELQEVLGDEDRDLNRHDLPKLVYLEAVIKESLRMYPPIPRIGRNSSSDVKLKQYTLPANCTYAIALYGLNRHPMWGADAEQFRPERWLDPATLPENLNAFASFSLGKRNCLGKPYAMMAMKTNLAHILRRYRVTGDIKNLETTCDLLLQPVYGHHISLELRI